MSPGSILSLNYPLHFSHISFLSSPHLITTSHFFLGLPRWAFLGVSKYKLCVYFFFPPTNYISSKNRKRVKVKLSLCFNWAPRHVGVLGEWRYSSTHSLTSALDEGEWSSSRPGRFTPRERAPFTHWIGGWVGSRAVLDAVVKRKIPSPRRESNPRTLSVQPVAQRYTDW
jgi:hypothetical protein